MVQKHLLLQTDMRTVQGMTPAVAGNAAMMYHDKIYNS